MDIINIENIIKEKDNIKKIKFINQEYESKNYLKSIIFLFFSFEIFAIYPLIAFFLGMGSLSITLILPVIALQFFFIEKFQEPKLLTGLILGFFNIEKYGIKKDSELGGMLEKNFINSKKHIKKVKNYYETLTEIQKDAFIQEKPYECLLSNCIQKYINLNSIETIKHNQDKLINILMDEVSTSKRDKFAQLIKDKLAEDRKIQKANLVNIFKEDEKERNLTVNNKIVREI